MKSFVVSIFVLLVVATAFGQEKPNMMANVPETEAEFTEEQLKDYYVVYENKAVRHIREVVNRYLKSSKKLDDETEDLKSIDRSYLSGRFTVLSRDPDVFGNTHVMLIAIDKPDKVFIATVYTGNGFRLDGFVVDSRFNAEDMRIIKIRYKRFLADTKHSL